MHVNKNCKKKKLIIIIVQSLIPRFMNINESINILNDELITDDWWLTTNYVYYYRSYRVPGITILSCREICSSTEHNNIVCRSIHDTIVSSKHFMRYYCLTIFAWALALEVSWTIIINLEYNIMYLININKNHRKLTR